MPTDMIPPALAEVGQLMLQSVFQHFKHDAQHRTQPPVSQNQGLKTDPNKKRDSQNHDHKASAVYTDFKHENMLYQEASSVLSVAINFQLQTYRYNKEDWV